MKKTTIILLSVFIVIFFAYLLFPEKSVITQTTINDVSETNAARFLTHKSNWRKWWPGKVSPADSNLFIYDGINFRLIKGINSGMNLQISYESSILESNITYLTQDNLKVKITWEAERAGENNVFKKVSRYQSVSHIENGIIAILNHLKAFLGNDQNVYGFNIHLAKVKDSVMLATSVTVNKYPDNDVIEPMIKKLRRLIKEQGAVETNHPMLNIHQLGKQEFEVMTAIPINKQIVPKENAVINKMVLGNILVANVKGGRNTINNAFTEIKAFSKDYHFTAPAMPFELMITDRSAEKDTSKWLTDIYYPIF